MSPDPYSFPAQAPGIPLAAGAPATVTLAPCPLGVSGTDVHHSLYVSGGTGTPEPVPITGGTCTSGAATGTITFTPVYAHAGAWTIASGTGGARELELALTPGVNTINITAPTTMQSALWLDVPGITLYIGSRVQTNRQIFVSAPNVTIAGPGTVQALANANLPQVVYTYNTATGFRWSGVTCDGNRKNFGTIQGSPSNACLLVAGSQSKIRDAEFRNTQNTGIFVGDNTITPIGVEITGSYIHDNGGVIDATGFGQGIYAGGAVPVSDLKISGNLIARNYNTVGNVGMSNGFNMSAGSSVNILSNKFADNLDVSNGGQIDLGSDNCAANGSYEAVQGNTVVQTIAALGDVTAGIEVCTGQTIVSGNTVAALTGPGIVLDGVASGGTVAGNTLSGGTAGILLGSASGYQIAGNTIISPIGVVFSSAAASRIMVQGNDLSRCTMAVAGLLSATQDVVVENNLEQ
jgi:parallel beta-helix repeat protein